VWLLLVLLPGLAISGCSGSGVGPSIPECEYSRTGTLVMVNLTDTLNPRDLYVDGRYIGLVRYQNQVAVTAAAGVHVVEWVSVVTGSTVDSIRVVVDQCSTATVTNLY
jgi:hypothetical protein